jgi:hypothetical protein
MARYSKTLTPASQAAFVAALRGGALVEAAARAVGVAISTLYWRRKRGPAFAAAWDCAVALSAGAPGRRLRFGAGRRRRFLASFGCSCNLAWACEETGVDPTTVYRHIARDPGFARDCRAALARGYDFLEGEPARQRAAAAARHAKRGIATTAEPTEDFDEGMKLLARWTRPDGSIGPRFVRRGRMKSGSFEEAIALLEKKLRGRGIRIAGEEEEEEDRGRDEGAATG